MRQRLAVHLERDECVRVQRAIDGQALGEIGRGGKQSGVSAFEHDLERIAFTPTRFSTSRRRTPPQSALPIAPYVHCTPPARGVNRPRRLPEH
jgi:hypothetical protein